MQIHTFLSSFIQKHAFTLGVFSVLFGFTFLAGGFVVANGQTLSPSDSHIVSMYIDGTETIIPTRAATVGELIEKADIKLAPEDLVEPAKDTVIDTDNFRISVYKARPVTIIDEQEVTRVLSPYQGAKMVAEKAGVVVYPEDTFIVESGSSFVDEQIIGEKITIDRATPVTVSLYGTQAVEYRTHATTVGEFLKEKSITPEEGSTLIPDVSTIINSNTAIFISKFGKQVVTEDVSIPFDITSSADPNTAFGRVTVVSAGVPGVKKVTYEIETKDGKEVKRTVLQEVVVSQPVIQTQTKGTKSLVSGDKQDWMRSAGISEDQFASVDFIIGRESGWRPGALNAGGCAGLGQACPGSKLANACPDWQIDPVCQLKFFSGYANGRYGSWNEAYKFWIVQHWW